MIRIAEVRSDRVDLETVLNYLPGNYGATEYFRNGEKVIMIIGEDDHGWTMGGYVIPRLGSALIHAKEIV